MNIPLHKTFQLGFSVGIIIGLIILNQILPGKGEISILISIVLTFAFHVHQWNKVLYQQRD